MEQRTWHPTIAFQLFQAEVCTCYCFVQLWLRPVDLQSFWLQWWQWSPSRLNLASRPFSCFPCHFNAHTSQSRGTNTSYKTPEVNLVLGTISRKGVKKARPLLYPTGKNTRANRSLSEARLVEQGTWNYVPSKERRYQSQANAKKEGRRQRKLFHREERVKRHSLHLLDRPSFQRSGLFPHLCAGLSSGSDLHK